MVVEPYLLSRNLNWRGSKAYITGVETRRKTGTDNEEHRDALIQMLTNRQ